MGTGDLELSFTTYLLAGPDDDNDDIERATAGIEQDWGALGTIGAPQGLPAPPGARGVDAAQVGAIVATIAPGGLAAALHVLWQWVDARGGRTVEIVRAGGSSLKVTHPTQEEQRVLIAAWIAEGFRE